MIYACIVLSMFWGLKTVNPEYRIRYILESEMGNYTTQSCIEMTYEEVFIDSFSDIWEEVDEALRQQGTDPDSITLS